MEVIFAWDPVVLPRGRPARPSEAHGPSYEKYGCCPRSPRVHYLVVSLGLQLSLGKHFGGSHQAPAQSVSADSLEYP